MSLKTIKILERWDSIQTIVKNSLILCYGSRKQINQIIRKRVMALNKLAIVKQRESFEFRFTLDDPKEDISGWVCTIFVKEFPADAAIFSRVVTPTAMLGPGS